ncbi:MAG: [protein-PII] uridylyltransferase [Acidobacteria bacterium]|nr:[protein-PII] uridylyltransferase [Acidobacteriota bacterium]
MTREQFQQQLQRIRDSRTRDNRSRGVLREINALLEQVVHEIFADAIKVFPGSGAQVSILATGGFGRKELQPHSDVDLILLFGQQLQAADEEFLKAFLHPLWDLGLTVGHHVLHPNQYSFDSRNLELATAFLDIRLIEGSPEMADRFKTEELPQILSQFKKELLRVLVARHAERHKRFNDTIYQLEPDIKEAPGGLRDFHTARWIGRILFGHESMAQFADHGLVAEGELEQILDAQNFLLALRNDLHFLTGRNRNVLSHEQQAEIATALNYPGDARQAVETLMKDYFLRAKRIHGLCESMIRHAFPPTRRISKSFKSTTWTTITVQCGALAFPDEETITNHPANMLKLFYRSAKYQIPISEKVLNQVKQHLHLIDDSVRGAAEVRDLFFKLLRQQEGVYDVLFLMHDIGLLGQIIPEFDKIRCHVIQDFFHKYTVDEHSLLTVKNLEDLYHTKKPREHRFASLLKSLARPELVLFSMLLHDVGKADPGNHCQNSLRDFEAIAARMHLAEEDVEKMRFLIQHHIEMSNTFQRRDVTDEAVVRRFADFIGTQENLRMLCLVTYADIKAVSPEALTPWKEDVLWQLYVETEAELTRVFADERWDTRQDKNLAREVAGLLSNTDDLTVGRVEAFLDGFPRRYLKYTPKQKIVEHFRLAEKVRFSEDLTFRLNRRRSTYELSLVALDRPFLFAKLTGVLSYFGMNILRGQAFANRQGFILDLIQFEDRLQTFKLNKSEIENFRETLQKVLTGELNLAELLRRQESSIRLRSKTKGSIPTYVSFDDQSSEKYTIMEIVTRDRYGLLFTIAKVIAQSECNIDVALISTEGQRAIDVFYLTQNQERLSPAVQEELASTMKEALDRIAA